MRLLFLVCLALIPSAVLFAADQPAAGIHDFRQVAWGMSRGEVMAIERAACLRKTETMLVYAAQFAGIDCELLYHFIQDQLTEAMYVVTAKHANREYYKRDYQDIMQVLSGDYGQPSLSRAYRKDDPEQEAPLPEPEWQAISRGRLAYLTVWETPATEIRLMLSGENNRIRLAVSYLGKSFAGLAQQAE